MANKETVTVTKKQIEESEKMWHNFVIGGKYAIYATAVILILLAVGFVDFTAVNHGH